MNIILRVILIFGLYISAIPIAGMAQSELPPPEDQIEAAVTPLPESMRQEASVLGYNGDEELVTLREGSNDMICLADDPANDRFHVACYYEDLEPFMKRGRELSREGKTSDEIEEIRREEIEAGDIPMPQKPMALYSLTGEEDGYDYSTSTLRQASPLYVIYVPYETRESTGMKTSPFGEGAPWLMDPGEPWAHIMVSPGTPLGEDVAE